MLHDCPGILTAGVDNVVEGGCTSCCSSEANYLENKLMLLYAHALWHIYDVHVQLGDLR